MKQTQSTKLLPLILIGYVFGLAVSGLTEYDLWHDEAWSIWAVQGSLAESLTKVMHDVHPPLYFLLLKGWVQLVGQSAYGVRYLSVGVGLLGAATTYRLGQRLFDRHVGCLALLWLGSHSFFVYYCREARMYTLLLALSALSMTLYWRWQAAPHWPVALGYGLTIAALPYTHYYGGLVILTQALHISLMRPRRLIRWLSVVGLGSLLYAPWLPVLWQQIQAHPDGPLTHPIPTNWGSIRWLMIILTGGAGLWATLPWLMGHSLPKLYRYRQPISLLTGWLLLTPTVVLAFNDWRPSFYEVRYTIAILPAASLLMGYALRQTVSPWLGGILLIGLISVNLNSYHWLWPQKVPWATEAIQPVIDSRQPDEPTLLMIKEPDSLEAYYDRVIGLRNSATVDLSHQIDSPLDLSQQVASLKAAPSLWVMMPSNVVETWLVMTDLTQQYDISQRYQAEHMLFYRFERRTNPEAHAPLQFHFADVLAYQGDFFTARPILSAGQPFCPSIRLKTLTDIADQYSFGLHLVDQANHLTAQHDAGLGAFEAEKEVHLTPCLTVPAGTAPGHYAVHLVIYRWADGQRLTVYEQDGLSWGNALWIEWMTIEKSK